MPLKVSGHSICPAEGAGMGIRIGILTLATLNMPESEYKQIANLLASTITQNRLIDCTLVKEIIKTYRIIN